jgi:hypothetical protein
VEMYGQAREFFGLPEYFKDSVCPYRPSLEIGYSHVRHLAKEFFAVRTHGTHTTHTTRHTTRDTRGCSLIRCCLCVRCASRQTASQLRPTGPSSYPTNTKVEYPADHLIVRQLESSN